MDEITTPRRRSSLSVPPRGHLEGQGPLCVPKPKPLFGAPFTLPQVPPLADPSVTAHLVTSAFQRLPPRPSSGRLRTSSLGSPSCRLCVGVPPFRRTCPPPAPLLTPTRSLRPNLGVPQPPTHDPPRVPRCSSRSRPTHCIGYSHVWFRGATRPMCPSVGEVRVLGTTRIPFDSESLLGRGDGGDECRGSGERVDWSSGEVWKGNPGQRVSWKGSEVSEGDHRRRFWVPGDGGW